MTAQRTLYARNAFAAASLALIGTLSAAPVQAQQPAGTTRAQVRAGAEAAVASGELTAQMGDQYGLVAPTASSTLRRADVRAVAEQEVREGRIDAHLAENDGTRPLALRVGRDLL